MTVRGETACQVPGNAREDIRVFKARRLVSVGDHLSGTKQHFQLISREEKEKEKRRRRKETNKKGLTK